MKIKDIIQTLDWDTDVKIENRREGLVFMGDHDEVPENLMEYRIVTIKIDEGKFNIWATK